MELSTQSLDPNQQCNLSCFCRKLKSNSAARRTRKSENGVIKTIERMRDERVKNNGFSMLLQRRHDENYESLWWSLLGDWMRMAAGELLISVVELFNINSGVIRLEWISRRRCHDTCTNIIQASSQETMTITRGFFKWTHTASFSSWDFPVVGNSRHVQCIHSAIIIIIIIEAAHAWQTE